MNYALQAVKDSSDYISRIGVSIKYLSYFLLKEIKNENFNVKVLLYGSRVE